MVDRIVPVLWDEECFSSSIYMEMVQGITTAAAQNQYTVKVYSTVESMLEKVQPDQTVIVIGYETPKLQTSLVSLTDHGNQVLLAGLDGERFGARVSSASPSRRQATGKLIQYLLKCGKERIALVACGDKSVNDMMRCETLKNILLARGYENPEDNIFFYHNYVTESFDAFLKRWQEFDAVICPNDYVALCLVKYLQERGIRIPEDLYLAAFSNRMVSRHCSPRITTMSIEFSGVGYCSFQAWLFLEEHKQQNLQIQITTPSRLVIRESTANEVHKIDDSNVIVFDADYQGGPFYTDPTIAKVMQIENCLTKCDSLSLQIIGALLEQKNYDYISESMFISRSALNYRLKKIFSAASVNGRKEFEALFRDYFTQANCF